VFIDSNGVLVEKLCDQLMPLTGSIIRYFTGYTCYI
jgi:hypothetical protein